MIFWLKFKRYLSIHCLKPVYSCFLINVNEGASSPGLFPLPSYFLSPNFFTAVVLFNRIRFETLFAIFGNRLDASLSCFSCCYIGLCCGLVEIQLNFVLLYLLLGFTDLELCIICLVDVSAGRERHANQTGNPFQEKHVWHGNKVLNTLICTIQLIMSAWKRSVLLFHWNTSDTHC